MKNVKMNKIPQFRQVVRDVMTSSTFVGLDEEGNAIYDNSLTQPSITFRGTVKLHGSSGSVCLHKGEVYAQSKNRVLTVTKDNFGFALFVEKHKEVFEEVLSSIASINKVDTDKEIISLFGEFAGKGIQKGVGISNIERSMFIFGCKVSSFDGDEMTSRWLEIKDFSPHLPHGNGIYDLDQFDVHHVNIDFSSPISITKAQETFERLTYEVEEECPVAKHFGFSGIGEGLVWSAHHNGSMLTFKTKGTKHSSSKVTKVANVDVEKVATIEEFVNYACTSSRFQQAVGEVFGTEEPTMKRTGDIIKWMVNDVVSEETDTLIENGLEPKDVNKYIAQDTKKRFVKYLDSLIGL